MAEPTYEDLRAALVNAEARIEERTERILKMDRELVETRQAIRLIEEQRQTWVKQLDERLAAHGYKPGDLQWRWRTEKKLSPQYPGELDDAILDALVNMGGATAWWGDGSSCAAQIVEAVLTERNAAETAIDAAQKRIEGLAAILTELLRLYDWRFTLAEREKDQRNASEKDFRVETRRLLNQYGAEKKAAWEAARAALSSRASLPREGSAAAPASVDADRALTLFQSLIYGYGEPYESATEDIAKIAIELARVRYEERESIAAWHDGWARECARIAEREHAAERHFNGTSCEAYQRLHEEAASSIRARASGATSAGGGE